MPEIFIQGINVKYRDLIESKVSEDGTFIQGEEILYSDLTKEEQYFKREKIPFTDAELIAIANREHEYTLEQKLWKDKQEHIFDNGIYAMIEGELTFIPGAYFCYVNYWTLEHGEKPEYREDDRIFFLFHEYLRLETIVLAVARLKGRRQGATSIGMFFMWFIAGRKEHKLCGMTSFNDTAAQDAFQKMFMFGFKSMLPCFQADFDSDSENFIRFVKAADKKKKGVLAVKREGLNSYCDYKSNVINSYDSGRQSYNVPDEGGKRNKLNISSYWSRLYKTFLVGTNKVGFGYLPTTVGAKKEGGENFKLFWQNANQYEIRIDSMQPVGIDTINRVVQYFVPASKCYAGCISKFGKSIEDDPDTQILSNEGKWITEGARTIILRERARLTGEQLMEHRRDYPLDEWDAFAFESGQCEFNEENFIQRIKYLEEHPQESYWRQGRLYDEYDQFEKKLIVKFADDKKGEWWIKEFPDIQNNYSDRNGVIEPLGSELYSAGADTYRNIFALNGSDGAISIIKKSHIIEGKERGLYPVAFFTGRPKLIEQFNRQSFLGCLLYGCKINFEIDAGTWFYENYLQWGALSLLEWTPAVDPTKKNFKITPGTESANPFQLAKQLEVAKMYFDGTSIDKYNGNVHRVTYIPLLKQGLEYNHSERTPYHLIVSFMMALLPMLAKPKRGNMTAIKPKNILPTFKIKMVS